MCSIDEAWAGQDFGGKQVVSQSDIHNTFMSLPDNLMTRNNNLNVINPNASNSQNESQSRSLSRGINSKYSREPRVPNITRNSENANISFSSSIPPTNTYGGLNPRPQYMEIYDKSDKSYNSIPSIPSPITTGDHFTDITTAYDVSNTVNNFMKMGSHNTNTNTNHNELLDEDNSDDISVANIKYNSIENQYNQDYNNSKTNFENVKPPVNRYNSSNSSNKTNRIDRIDRTDRTNMNIGNDMNIQQILQQIIIKLDNLENIIHKNNSRNMYDISLYVLIGMLFSFILYSICSKIKL